MTAEGYHFKLGTFDCMIVSDGTFAYPHPASLLFTNAPSGLLEQVLKAHNIDPEQWEHYISPYPSLVINTGQHLVLVDTGAGSFAPTTGKLMSNLQAEGITPEAIDTVILTHAHPDHIGGVVDDKGQLAFPNARYVMWQTEWDFWTSEPDLTRLQIPDHLREVLLQFARNNLPPLQDQLDLVEPETEIVPGIQAIAAPGHTPGHMALAVSSGNEQLLDIVDAAIHPIHLEQPDWYAAVDYIPEQVMTTRRQLLKRAAAEKALVFVYHFPFPGLGHVIEHGQGWQWQPLKTTA